MAVRPIVISGRPGHASWNDPREDGGMVPIGRNRHAACLLIFTL
jgi:hypothetical protein